MRRPEELGPTVTALLAVGHIAAWTLLGVTVHNGFAEQAAAAAPDAPLEQSDPPPAEPT